MMLKKGESLKENFLKTKRQMKIKQGEPMLKGR